ncbi:SDR family oxidoreductase [Amycolatopsis thermoflava]|uniref:Short-subunit dehydrogenase n=1 Tax=Amycolatopsis thermoflava TaxID=84480 RepID=A0A3N2GPA6_9PSEU|nr:SDR family oxidoreductase [Amycolatopsis thermoflava]ROS38458.1 short-subunit dehydrogenase [Amycolatopsis thermoflava]
MTGQERVWLITGASGGIGASLVDAALAAGDRVAALSRAPADDRARLRWWSADLTDPTRTREAVDGAVAAFGRLDVVVNNAGYAEPGAFEELSDDALRRQFEVNFFGAAHVLRAALPHLRAARRGRVVQISSLAGQTGAPGMSAYTASKHALEGLSVSLAAELAPLGIALTIVAPGATATGFRRRWVGKGRPARALADYDRVATALEHTGESYRPPSRPEDIARAVLALVEMPDPPLRLVVGRDALAAVSRMLAGRLDELEAYRYLTEAG